MESQGYTIESNLLYQHNNSTILLAKNKRMSADKNSKHSKNRFFYMGTKNMKADVNTKPMHGL
jgi:hypothetical protein